MDSEVLPTVERKKDALEQASHVTRNMRTVMERAEADAAALFRFLGPGVASSDGKTRPTENYSTGLRWYEEFDKDEVNDPEALIARRHYGDLQYFQGMAPEDGQPPHATKSDMLNWSRFLSDVSTGRIDPDTRLSDVPLTKELFPAHGDRSVEELFAYGDATDLEARQRAAGVLTHMIQDSYAAGHVDRDPLTGAIRQFHSYGSQDPHLHGEGDRWGRGQTLGDRIQGTQGAQASVDESVRVLMMLDQGVSNESVVQ